MGYLDINISALGTGMVIAASETDGGRVDVVRNQTLRCTVLESKGARAAEIASCDIRSDWAKSVGEPIDFIAEKFAHMKTGNQDVVVTPRVPKAEVDRLHYQLKKKDPNYTPAIKRKEDLKKVPKVEAFIKSHCTITPYSFDIQKCNDSNCCAAFSNSRRSAGAGNAETTNAKARSR